MNKRDFLQTVAAGTLGLALPGMAFSQDKKPAATALKAPTVYALQGGDVYGKAINLKDYLGKACLISFFTAECIPCTNDLRLMREFYGANRKRNYVNIGVNMDPNRQAIADYMDLIKKAIPVEQHFPIAWRNAKGHSDNFGAITSEPTHFVLDKEHKLVTRRNGVFRPADWDDLWTNLE
ncbi:peroxiredoxin family protein [Massilia sp. B-10]|nr:peroxiredoxin family protein [Massilia sp. B-10]UUZ53038.1 peroxiredoxin family protein [Massilia sp. H-1]